MSWGCGRAGRAKSTPTEDGSAGMRGSEDHGCGKCDRYDRPRGEAGALADATRCLNACWWRVHDWMGTVTEGHGYERAADRPPSERASIDCGGFHQQSLVEVGPLGKVAERWGALGRRCWVEEGEVNLNHRCVGHLWVERGWNCCLGEVEEDRLSRAVVPQC